MSSDSSEASNNTTRVYKLRSRRHFATWKQKALSNASSRGFDQFLVNNVPVKTQTELDTEEQAYINETDEGQRRIKKGQLSKMKRERKKSLAAAEMLTNSVRSKDLKILAKCRLNPKAMFDAICKKYGSEEDSDLTDLIEDFKECKLKGKKHDPEDWFGELDEINEQLEKIDSDFKKSDKEIGAHILANLPKGYRTIRKIIRMDDNYLDDLDALKKRLSKHWKNTYRKKSKKENYESESDSSDSSSESDAEGKKRSSKRNKDKYALNVEEDQKKDYYNRFGTIVCGHCDKPGHSIKECWAIHGKPKSGNHNKTNRRNQKSNNENGKCWVCGSDEHKAYNCPKKFKDSSEDEGDEGDGNINSLFIGTLMHRECTRHTNVSHTKDCTTKWKKADAKDGYILIEESEHVNKNYKRTSYKKNTCEDEESVNTPSGPYTQSTSL